MEQKTVGRILIAISVAGLICSTGAGTYYFNKTEKMRQEIDADLEVLYSMKGIVSEADQKLTSLSDMTLLFSQKAEGVLSSLDKFLSAINILSLLGVVNVKSLEESSDALRGVKDAIDSARNNIETFRQKMTDFKSFLETIGTLKQKVEETTREVKTVIVISTLYVCILNLIILWLGWKMLRA